MTSLNEALGHDPDDRLLIISATNLGQAHGANVAVYESIRTGVATTAEQYEDLWAAAGLAGQGPAVDFETEIVVWFGAVYGSSCPIRLDDVAVDPDRRLVFGGFVKPGNPTACTDDANPEAYVVALARHRLPEAPFAVQLDAEDPPSGAPEERTTVLDMSYQGLKAETQLITHEHLGEVFQMQIAWPLLSSDSQPVLSGIATAMTGIRCPTRA